MPVDSSTIAANIAHVQERIASAAARSGRRFEDVTLIAVSKTFPADSIRCAYEAGLRYFGENRVQEWESKRNALADLDATWHLIGHLQRNKAVRAVEIFHTIDSVDTVELARKLDAARQGAIQGAAQARSAKPLPILIEVRLSEEATKTGARETDLPNIVKAVLAMQFLNLRGLMVIPPFFDDPEQARPYFRRLRELRDSLRRELLSGNSSGENREHLLSELSMGMSHDFEIAIEEGATQVRIGTALFGARPKQPEEAAR